MAHPDPATLEEGIDEVRASPADDGVLELVVSRPAVDRRELLDEARLSSSDGLVGDTWKDRPNRRTADGSAHPEMQLNIINARMSRLLSHDDDIRALAGDQLHVDLDLREANLPPGTRLSIGSAVIEITAMPHTGCAKFSARFGQDAVRFVNSPIGRELRLRGVNAKVVTDGVVRPGDKISKV